MNELLGIIEAVPGIAVQRQITNHVRRLIRGGKLPDGSRLPSTQELARLWNSSPRTVHLGLSPLVKEGWLQRSPTRGTFVRRREAQMTCIGIYYPEDIWAQPKMAFLQAFHAELKRTLGESDVAARAWVDPRPASKAVNAWSELQEAVATRAVQGLVVPVTDPAHLGWLTKLAVPSVFVSSAPLPNVVGYDIRQFATLAAQELARQGARSVGLICALGTEPHGALAGHDGEAFYEHFVSECRQRGLTLRDTWIKFPHAHTLTAGEHERFGFEAFSEIWRESRRPEGLIVYPDSLAAGAVMSLLARNVRVPGNLRLVLHRNEGIPFFCPVEAGFVVSSVREVATAAWRQLQRQFDGETVQPVLLPFRMQE